MASLKYKKGFLYQVVETIEFQTNIKLEDAIFTDFIRLFTDGTLMIIRGYAFDGPSGPTKWITKCLPGQWLKDKWLKTIMKGSAAHDGLYELMRLNHIPLSWRSEADATMLKICKKVGMSKFRLWWIRVGLDKLARFAALPKNKKEILKAP